MMVKFMLQPFPLWEEPILALLSPQPAMPLYETFRIIMIFKISAALPDLLRVTQGVQRFRGRKWLDEQKEIGEAFVL